MIKEAYCSFEVCKLLKEKGLKLQCLDLTRIWFKDNEKPVTKVTHQMATAWLREKGLEISISYGFPFIDGKQVFKYFWRVIKVCGDHLEYPMEEVMSNTYEEATEAACIYALENLI